MNELHLFAGAGGGILGSILLGHKIVCAVECDPWCQAVLLQRQKDGILPSFPIWDDVRTFDGRPWRGIVDCISGGFPCQDISTAGKGEGITGPSSGLWKEFARVIDEMGPRYVFLENSPALTSRGLGVVLGDLASMGFDAEWCVLGASDCGARHERERIWILAHSTEQRPGRRPEKICKKDERQNGKMCRKLICSSEKYGNLANARIKKTGRLSGFKREKVFSPRCNGGNVSNTLLTGLQKFNENGYRGETEKAIQAWSKSIGRNSKTHKNLWEIEPGLGRVVDGMANRLDRVRVIGNGQVPFVAYTAWNTLMGRMG